VQVAAGQGERGGQEQRVERRAQPVVVLVELPAAPGQQIACDRHVLDLVVGELVQRPAPQQQAQCQRQQHNQHQGIAGCKRSHEEPELRAHRDATVATT
jgi:hypothetical protein